MLYIYIYRSEKTSLHCGNRIKLVLIRNWIVRVGVYDLDFANQNDARLVVQSADTYDAASNGHSSVVQFVNVRVIYLHGSREFFFRFVIIFLGMFHKKSDKKAIVIILFFCFNTDYMRLISKI